MVSVYLSEICHSLFLTDLAHVCKSLDINLSFQLLCQGLVVSEGETAVEGQEEGLTEELWVKYRWAYYLANIWYSKCKDYQATVKGINAQTNFYPHRKA